MKFDSMIHALMIMSLYYFKISEVLVQIYYINIAEILA